MAGVWEDAARKEAEIKESRSSTGPNRRFQEPYGSSLQTVPQICLIVANFWEGKPSNIFFLYVSPRNPSIFVLLRYWKFMQSECYIKD